MEPLENLRKIRLEKLAKIQKLGIDPYPAKSHKKDSIATCLKSQGKVVATAGRIMSIRAHGGSTFADLVDESAKIQLFFSKDKLSAVSGQLLAFLDLGDFIQCNRRDGIALFLFWITLEQDASGLLDTVKQFHLSIFSDDFD